MTRLARRSAPAGGATVWLELPDPPAIPGLRFRGLRDDDWPALVEVCARANIEDRIPWAPDAESLRVEWAGNPGLDLADVVVAEVDGVVVAVAGSEFHLRDGRPVHDAWGFVDPAWRRRGLGRTLLAENVLRSQERARTASMADGAPSPDEPAAAADPELGSWLHEYEAGSRALLEGAGFRPVRWFFLMLRPSLADVPDAPLPAGLEVRPVAEDQRRAVLLAEDEAFEDHWGHRPMTDDDIEALQAMPDFDPSLWQVAWDGDEVAGVVQTWIWRSENERLGLRRGWLEHISVRRPWRRRGLARALTARALFVLRDAGMADAMLGVDADNPTGALGLYESLGFEVHQRGVAYRRPLWDAGERGSATPGA